MYAESKFGKSPFLGVKDAENKLVCGACGIGGHVMRKCISPGKPSNVPPGTPGYHYTGLDGPSYAKHMAYLARTSGQTSQPPAPPSDQASQHGNAAVTNVRPTTSRSSVAPPRSTRTSFQFPDGDDSSSVNSNDTDGTD